MNRYDLFSQTLQTKDGVSYESPLMFVDFCYSGDVQWHQITLNEDCRPDLIAYKWFGDASLWPYIAWFNNIQDPLTGFASVIEKRDQDGDVVFQTDMYGNMMLDANNQPIPVLEPNVIMIPTDITQFISGTVPFTYRQRA